MPVQASWEPDLWGRVREYRQGEHVRGRGQRVADLENVRLAAQAELAVDYYELRAQDDMETIARWHAVNAYKEAMELTRRSQRRRAFFGMKLCRAG